jgi:hypothetical protein
VRLKYNKTFDPLNFLNSVARSVLNEQ